ncbi:hypothetical protein JOC86_004283 [Bacillus pakistanensis]|uniref:Uncharacterized protein n=1 Tax=Rossellomorea pakistanensis TaxID=992288 RepID=A0ABS2NIL7_9BACI|nr:hypothetical protein [Bacillus pakistanensis]MBM7587709.1 hypothetical protein [Bacillus pakistanensis]
MTEKDRVRNIVSKLLKLSGSGVKVKIEERCPLNRNIGGKYNLQQHTITLYQAEIRKQCDLLYPGKNVFDDYTAVVFSHELGHATDRSLQKLVDLYDRVEKPFQKRKIEFLIEVQAWKNAKKLVPDIPAAFFNHIKHHSLEKYYMEINKHYEGNAS